jgi:hypothetical protein
MVGGNNRSTNNGVTKIKTERKEAISTATKFKIDFHLKGKYSSLLQDENRNRVS